MKARAIMALVLATTLMAITFVGCVSSPEIILQDGFEQGMGDWAVGMDLPIDPETDIPVQASVAISSERARSGEASINITIDGRQDDGIVWVMRSITVPSDGAIDLKISFFVYSESESFNTIAHVVAYIGDDQPVNENSFEKLGPANPAEGWNEFHLENKLDSDGEIWIAVGISVAWETWMTYFIDDISVASK
ncbi:MAG: hypothetical protein GKC03_08765 [Methanomassiliicoccales archaeon]|nr:hypothetical protein [Methanomassiliicoccales archaeon]NYT15373.1 hypothetical protein [Methanomassiliicoccales archaeon]